MNIKEELERIKPQLNYYIQNGEYHKAIDLTSSLEIKKLIKNQLLTQKRIWFDAIPYVPELQFDIYSMDYDSIVLLQRYILDHRPMTILECGGGVSSILLSLTIQNIQLSDPDYKPHYISVESEEKFSRFYYNITQKYNLDSILTYIHSPLQACRIGLTFSQFYDLKKIIKENKIAKIDMLIVDGPVGYAQHKARRPAYFLAKGFLNSGSSIFLDDTNRDDEKEIFQEWVNDIKNCTWEWYESMAKVTLK